MKECSCNVCLQGCKRRPGWFRPGEAEKAASLLGLSLQEFFNTKLGVDAWMGDPDIYLLAPALVGEDPGTEYPFSPRGRCIFLTKDNKCEIHAAKPDECAFAHHDTPIEDCTSNRQDIVKSWEEHQDQIIQLLGREPFMEEPSLMDGLSLMFGSLGLGEFNDYDED
jgi:Fe-S-cluster containining protein